MHPWIEANPSIAMAISAAVTAVVARVWSGRRERRLAADLAVEAEAKDAALQQLHQAQIDLGGLQGVVAGLEKARADVEAMRGALKAEFAEVAGQTLTTTSQQFLQLANAELSTHEQSLQAQLEQRQAAIDATLKPLQTELGRMSTLTRELDGKRENTMGTITTRLTDIEQAAKQLRDQSQALAEALRGNVRARGRWGEQTLRRIVEMGGLQENCDFSEQDGTSEARPDMVVRLPDNGLVPVDAKAPLEHFLKAQEGRDSTERDESFRAHAAAVRNHVRTLAKRDYPTQLGHALGLTVMFLPTEPMLAVAIEQAPDLFEEAQRSRVLLATPMTLLAMLKTIAVFWHQHRLVQNAKEIVDVAQELYHRVATFQEHFGKVAKGLQTANDAMNAAASSFNQRVVVTGRKLVELGAVAAAKKQIEELPIVTTAHATVVLPMPARLPAEDRAGSPSAACEAAS